MHGQIRKEGQEAQVFYVLVGDDQSVHYDGAGFAMSNWQFKTRLPVFRRGSDRKLLTEIRKIAVTEGVYDLVRQEVTPNLIDDSRKVRDPVKATCPECGSKVGHHKQVAAFWDPATGDWGEYEDYDDHYFCDECDWLELDDKGIRWAPA
jgi:hypothetical protein